MDSSISELSENRAKFRLVFQNDVTEDDLKRHGIDVKSFKRDGKMLIITTKGDEKETARKLEELAPAVVESMPLTLEEVFLDEMEGTDYDFAEIFQNNFGYAFYTGLRENALFAVLNAVFLALFFCVMPIQTFMSTTQTDFETGKVSIIEYSKVYAFLFAPQLQYFRYFIIAVLLGVGILMGIAAFRFITGKKTVNVYYSLGIKRQKLFAAKYLSGLTLIAGSVLVPMVVSLIANIAVLGFNKFMLPAFFYLLLTMFSLVAVSYTLTALVFSAVGTVFEGILFSGVVLLTPEILFSSMEILIKKLVFGTPLGSVFRAICGSARLHA